MNNEKWNSEVRINKDILKYGEQIFLGLNLKQTICGAATLIVAAFVYFIFNKILGQNLATIMCAVFSAPIAAIGFIEFNGMTFVQLIKAIFEHQFMADKLFFKSKNYYKELIELDKYITSNEGKKKDVEHL